MLGVADLSFYDTVLPGHRFGAPDEVAESCGAGAVVVSVTGTPRVESPSEPAAAVVSVTATDGSVAFCRSFSAPIAERA